ncbi:MAG: HEPN domain-containing protein [Candidatus Omnitrophica bacterium]|nr:HEPN domain-containing protein [Candidatus Omnitrophota bacterium]
MLSHVTSEIDKIDALFKFENDIINDEVRAYWAEYLCVRVAGLIEAVLRIILFYYAKNKSHENVARYVSKKVEGVTNLNSEKIENLLGDFSEVWQERYVQNITDSQKAAIGNIYINRNRVGHGRNSELSYYRVKEYYKEIKGALLAILKIVEA